MTKNSNKKPLKKLIKFSGIAIQMGLTIYLGNKLGEWLDSKYINKHQTYTKLFTLIAVFGSMFSIIKQAVNLSKNKNDD